MIRKKIRLNNELGLHARPASVVVQKAEDFSSQITITKDDKEANLKSILGVLWLRIKDQDQVLLEVEGEDEEIAAEAITELFENKLSKINYRKIKVGEKQKDSISSEEIISMMNPGIRSDLEKSNVGTNKL
ncbi:MAG: HPr family phosphocarrier protein [Bacillota bacterium]